eukprot:m.47471 g.47471  ORF g.47471 m.47471 type:complete len:792 (-) comp15225_c0_seq4:93-2468(-)
MSGITPAKGDTANSICARCSEVCYVAESVKLDGKTWHKRCFSCQECRRPLTFTTYFVTHGINAIFCKKCGPVLAPKYFVGLVGGRSANTFETPPVTDHDDVVSDPASPTGDGGELAGKAAEQGYHESGFPNFFGLSAQKAATEADESHASQMQYSEEGTYDNPGVVAGMRPDDFVVGDGQTLPGTHYDMSAPLTGPPGAAPISPRAAESQRMNDQVRNAKVDPMQATADHMQALDLSPHPAALEDRDYGQPCQKCTTCPGFILHRWRKVCQMCQCTRFHHRSREVSERRRRQQHEPDSAEARMKYAWTPAGASKELVELYFKALPVEFVPEIGTEGEIWRHEQLLVQLPAYDTDVDKSSRPNAQHVRGVEALDDIRLTEALDIGTVQRCPDLSRPAACDVCGLREDGTHWAYCSEFVEPDRTKRTVGRKSGGRRTSDKGTPTPGEAEAWAGLFPDATPVRSIKAMKKGGSVASTASPGRSIRSTRKSSRGVSDDGEGGAAVDEDVFCSPTPGDVSTDVVSPAPRVASGARCYACNGVLFVDAPVVACGRFNANADTLFHPTCFACSECGELLVDLRAFVDCGKEERGVADAPKKLFCGRHWNDNRYPRCHGCDESIFDADFVYEFGKSYHVEHFCCQICDTNLTAHETFVPRGRKPYCFPCYGVHFADKCRACRKPINPTPGFGGKVTIGTTHWHGGCFKCVMCSTSLAGKPCIPRDDGLFCKPCLKKVLRAQKALDAKNKSARHPRRKTVPTSQQPPPPPASRAVARVSSSASADTDGDDGSDDDDEEDV